MAAEIVLDLARWDPVKREFAPHPARPPMLFDVAGVQAAARILICEADSGPNAVLLFDEVSAYLADGVTPPRVLNRFAFAEYLMNARVARLQILAITLDKHITTDLDRRTRKWESDFRKSVIIPIVPTARARVLEKTRHLGRWQAAVWVSRVHECAPDVLRAAGLGRRRALFISYRHKESSELAARLWRKLTELGFDTFLDRHSLAVGRPFLDQLRQRIAICDCLVLLESPSALKSDWVKQEIAVARIAGIGVVAITHARANAKRGVEWRKTLTARTWAAPGARSITEVSYFIREKSALAALRARATCERALQRAAVNAGVPLYPRGATLFLAVLAANAAIIAPTGQPALISNVREAHEVARSGRHDYTVIAGAHELLDPLAHEDLKWVAAQSNVQLRRRHELTRILRNLSAGVAP